MDEEKGRQVNRVIAREFLIFLFAYGLPLVLWVILLALNTTDIPGQLGIAGPSGAGMPGEAAVTGPVISLKQLLVPLLIYLPVQIYRFARRRTA